MGKRTIALQEQASIISDLYLEVDKSGWSEAKKISVSTLITTIQASVTTVINNIIDGCGLESDGTYDTDEATNFLKLADFAAAALTPSLKNADIILDDILFNDVSDTHTVFVSSDGVDALNNGGISNPLQTIAYTLANRRAALGHTTIILLDEVVETATVDLSIYLDITIRGFSKFGCGILNSTTSPTLQYTPIGTSNDIYLQDITIENTKDDKDSQAALIGGINAASNIFRLGIDNVKFKARGGEDGILQITNSNTTSQIQPDHSFKDISIEWGTKPTGAVATTYGLYFKDVQNANVSIITNNVMLINLGWDNTNAQTTYGIYDNLTTTDQGLVVMNNTKAYVSPITTGNKYCISGASNDTKLELNNTDIHINGGNDIDGDLYGIRFARCFDCKCDIYREYDDDTHLAKNVAIYPNSYSTNNIGKVDLCLTATVAFTIDEDTCGVYILGDNDYYGLNEGILRIKAGDNNSIIADTDSSVAGIVLVASGINFSGGDVIGTTQFDWDIGGLAPAFTDFDGVRTIMDGSGGIICNNIRGTLQEITNVGLTTCSAIGIVKVLLASTLVANGGSAAYVDSAVGGSYAGNAMLKRGSGAGNVTFRRAAGTFVRSRFTLGAGASVTVDANNMSTI